MTIKAFVKQHPILTYYAVAFAISWGAILILVGFGGFLSTTSTSPTFALVGFTSILGPSVAGILMTALVDGRAGFRELLSRLLRWRVGLRWYAVALLTAPLVTILTLLALSLTSQAFVPAIITTDDKASLLLYRRRRASTESLTGRLHVRLPGTNTLCSAATASARASSGTPSAPTNASQ